MNVVPDWKQAATNRAQMPAPIAWTFHIGAIGLIAFLSMPNIGITTVSAATPTNVMVGATESASRFGAMVGYLTGNSECIGDDINSQLLQKAEPLVYIGNVPVLGTRDSEQKQRERMGALMLMASGDAQAFVQRRNVLLSEKERALGSSEVAAAISSAQADGSHCGIERAASLQAKADVDAMRKEDREACQVVTRDMSDEQLLCVAMRRLGVDRVSELAQKPECNPQYTILKKTLKRVDAVCIMPTMNMSYALEEEPAKRDLLVCEAKERIAARSVLSAIVDRATGDIDVKLQHLENERQAAVANAIENYAVELRNVRLNEQNEELRKVGCSAEVYGILSNRPNAALKLGVVDYSIQRPDGGHVLISMARNYDNAEEDQMRLLSLFVEASEFSR